MVQIQPTCEHESVLESHQRKLVDGSDPASETKRPSAFKSDFSFIRLRQRRRLALNNPPTSVGGIRKFSKAKFVGRI
jgi:hypothetical protein